MSATNDASPSQSQLNSLLEHYQSGRYEDAEKLAIAITQQFPNHSFSWKVLAAVLKQTGRISEALVANQKAVEIAPQDAEAHSNLGNTLQALGRFKESEESFTQAIALKPHYAEVHSNLGVTLKALGRFKEAEASYRQAIALKPDFAEAHSNLGNILKDLGRFKEAEASHRQAIALKPDFAEAHSNLGVALKELGRLEEAEASYRQALALKTDYAEAHSNLGVTLKDLGRLEEARESFMQALNIKPNFSEAMMNLESSTAAAVPTWHLSMMNDKSRNSAYLEALKLAVDDGSFVLEIGTGSGLLSMMAATCGAGEIITCETSTTIANIATKIIHRNGYGENISVINKKSTELIVGEDLPRKADLVISEVLSSEFVGEGVRSTILDANKRLLKKNGKMIPKSGDIRISLLGNNAEILDAVSVGSSHGFDLSEFNSISRRKFNLKLHEKPTLLSNPENAFSINLYDMNEIVKEEKIIKLRANQDGLCLGLIQWLRVQLYKDIEYENNPCDTFSHWQTPIYIFDDPVEVTVGQVLEIRAFLNEDSVHFYHSNSKANNVSN